MSQAADTAIPSLSRAYSAVSADPEHLWNHTKAQLALLLLADSDVLAHAYTLATNVCAQLLSDLSVELENMILRAPDTQSALQVSPISVSDIKDRKASRRWLEENAPASGTFRLPQEEAVSEMGGA
ncbi:hypothetical protein EBT31_07565, partial [bacterium]|nr:hypothetical protein [bacterium]